MYPYSDEELKQMFYEYMMLGTPLPSEAKRMIYYKYLEKEDE